MLWVKFLICYWKIHLRKPTYLVQTPLLSKYGLLREQMIASLKMAVYTCGMDACL